MELSAISRGGGLVVCRPSELIAGAIISVDRPHGEMRQLPADCRLARRPAATGASRALTGLNETGAVSVLMEGADAFSAGRSGCALFSGYLPRHPRCLALPMSMPYADAHAASEPDAAWHPWRQVYHASLIGGVDSRQRESGVFIVPVKVPLVVRLSESRTRSGDLRFHQRNQDVGAQWRRPICGGSALRSLQRRPASLPITPNLPRHPLINYELGFADVDALADAGVIEAAPCCQRTNAPYG